jgi:hypothetical protein
MRNGFLHPIAQDGRLIRNLLNSPHGERRKVRLLWGTGSDKSHADGLLPPGRQAARIQPLMGTPSAPLSSDCSTIRIRVSRGARILRPSWVTRNPSRDDPYKSRTRRHKCHQRFETPNLT